MQNGFGEDLLQIGGQMKENKKEKLYFQDPWPKGSLLENNTFIEILNTNDGVVLRPYLEESELRSPYRSYIEVGEFFVFLGLKKSVKSGFDTELKNFNILETALVLWKDGKAYELPLSHTDPRIKSSLGVVKDSSSKLFTCIYKFNKCI